MVVYDKQYTVDSSRETCLVQDNWNQAKWRLGAGFWILSNHLSHLSVPLSWSDLRHYKTYTIHLVYAWVSIIHAAIHPSIHISIYLTNHFTVQ